MVGVSSLRSASAVWLNTSKSEILPLCHGVVLVVVALRAGLVKPIHTCMVVFTRRRPRPPDALRRRCPPRRWSWCCDGTRWPIESRRQLPAANRPTCARSRWRRQGPRPSGHQPLPHGQMVGADQPRSLGIRVAGKSNHIDAQCHQSLRDAAPHPVPPTTLHPLALRETTTTPRGGGKPTTASQVRRSSTPPGAGVGCETPETFGQMLVDASHVVFRQRRPRPVRLVVAPSLIQASKMPIFVRSAPPHGKPAACAAPPANTIDQHRTHAVARNDGRTHGVLPTSVSSPSRGIGAMAGKATGRQNGLHVPHKIGCLDGQHHAEQHHDVSILTLCANHDDFPEDDAMLPPGSTIVLATDAWRPQISGVTHLGVGLGGAGNTWLSDRSALPGRFSSHVALAPLPEIRLAPWPFSAVNRRLNAWSRTLYTLPPRDHRDCDPPLVRASQGPVHHVHHTKLAEYARAMRQTTLRVGYGLLKKFHGPASAP